jgi:hypothetical protein
LPVASITLAPAGAWDFIAAVSLKIRRARALAWSSWRRERHRRTCHYRCAEDIAGSWGR